MTTARLHHYGIIWGITPFILRHTADIRTAVNTVQPGEVREVPIPTRGET